MNTFWPNLQVSDVPRIPPDRLNVFVSLACENDQPILGPNLAAAMYERASVAVVSATTTVIPGAVEIQAAEIDALTRLYSNPENLALQIHAFRAKYYAEDVVNVDPVTQQLRRINLFTVNLIGDGLAKLAR